MATTSNSSSNSPRPSDQNYTRRDFVKGSAAMAAVPLVGSLATPVGAWAGGSDKLRVGLIGCGGRGTGAAIQAIRADKGAVLVALGDVFSDRLESAYKNLVGTATEMKKSKKYAGGDVAIDDDHKFVGFDAYQKVIDAVDVVLLATPPYFRPQHLEAAIKAGKHVFCEKPMAVDGPGVRSVLESAALAKKKGLSLVSGFCWRYDAGKRGVFNHIVDGGIGAVRAAHHIYNANPLYTNKRQAQWSEMEFQLRNWQHFTWLSGDHIVEQAVHSVDKMMWGVNELPAKAEAVGGRQCHVGEERGNVFDHFGVTYKFPSGARGFLMCRQIANADTDNTDYVMGEDGVADIKGWSYRHVISGKKPWKYKGERNSMYQQEHDELFASIRNGEAKNDGIWMAHSTLAGIMGRMAAYTGKTVTWERALESKDLLGPTAMEWGDVVARSVAKPGVTKLI